jgi:CheY-like chemotaxis protein
LVTSFVSRKDTPEPELLESDEFLQEPARVLARVRVLYEDLAASSDPETRGAALAGMYRKVRSIGGQAAAAGYHDYARYVSAFEGLLRQLHERPDRLTLSARRTVGATVDFLASLLSRVDDLHEHRLTGAQCLVVDDDPVSVEVERAALARAKLTACTTSDPTAALRLAEGQALDLALVDVEMPGMDGYAFCQGLRRLAAHRSTPILFVTSHGDLESRIRCLVAGGHDMLTKPFLGTELAVKALTCVLRHRLALA